MQLEYTSTANDIVETHWRLLSRTGTNNRNRLISAALSGAICALLGWVASMSFAISPWIIPAMGVLGVVVLFTSYENSVRKSLRKTLESSYGDKIPAATKYTIHDGKLTCEFLEVALSFALNTLSSIEEDEEYLEINFGVAHICLIPLRSFRSGDERRRFCDEVKSAGEEQSMGDPA